MGIILVLGTNINRNVLMNQIEDYAQVLLSSRNFFSISFMLNIWRSLEINVNRSDLDLFVILKKKMCSYAL